MSAITEIYDFETAIEEAFRAALAAADLTAYTVATVPDESDIEAAQQFQKSRPRVTLHLETGGAAGMLLANGGIRASSGSSPEQCYSGTLTLEVLTEAAIASHRTYRATVRRVMDTICPDVNGDPLTKHKVQKCKASGTSAIYSSDQGAYVSKLTYDLDFSIQTEAWADLT